MPHTTRCADCGHTITLPDGSEGKKVRCPACNVVNSIHGSASGGVYLVAEEVGAAAEEMAPTLRADAGGAAPVSRRSASRTGGRAPEGGTTVFVLGLLGITVCGILAPIAWVMGNDYEKKCKSARAQPEGLAVAGRIMGMIGTALMALAVLFFVFMMIFAVGSADRGY